MSKHPGSGKIGSTLRALGVKTPSIPQSRHLGFESLEVRRLLSTVGLNSISNVTLPAGASVLVALNGSDTGQTIQFSATTSNPQKVTPTVMPETNKSVEFKIAGYGTMTFQLFDNLTPTAASYVENLVNENFYNGDYIYRAQSGFVIQGGNDPPQLSSTYPDGIRTPPAAIDEEYSPDLTYTTAGDLAMARTGSPNSSSTEFFVSEANAEASLNFGYTLYGFQTTGQSIVSEIQQQPTVPVTQTAPYSYLDTPIEITSASIINDTQNGVLMLRAPTGTTGTYSVTVTASDGTNTPTTQTFNVTVEPDTSGGTANPWAADTPTAPTAVAFQPSSGQSSSLTSDNNASASQELKFLVSGVTDGNLVTVYANGVAIGSAVAGSGGSTVVTTSGTSELFNGTYTITATQTDQNVAATDSADSDGTYTANVDSYSSPDVQLQVFNGLSVTSTPATSVAVGGTYTYTLQTNAPSGDTVSLALPSAATSDGVTYNSSTQTVSWTPTSSQTGQQTFDATVTDAAGNSVTLPLDIDVVSTNAPAAPTTIAFEPQTGQGTTTITSANNSSSSEELQFLVSGVVAGDTVNLYADGSTTAIATGTVASGDTTITLTTNGTSTLSNGAHTFTATQTSGTTASATSSALDLTVFNGLTATATETPTERVESATVGTAFSYTFTGVSTNAPSGDTVTYALSSTAPTGMTFDSSTDTVSWTPTSDQEGETASFAITATDTAGNSASTLPIYVSVAAASGITVVAPTASIAVGSPVLVAFNDSDTSGTPTYTVTTSSTADSNGADLTATVTPLTNQVLEVMTNYGEMDFQLLNNYTPNTVSHFTGLVDSGTYTNTTFYRIIEDFMDQGGVNASGTGSSIPVELNDLLRFTSSGLLAMANDGVDGNSSEFFITNPNDTSDGFLDFRYTIFGKLIAGDAVRGAISSTPVTTNSSGEDSQPVTAPQILSMKVVTETDAGVFMLNAATGASGPYTVTVSDGLGNTQTFSIKIGTNSYDPPNPWVKPITVGTNSSGTNPGDQIYTAENTAVTFTPQGEAAEGGTAQVNVQLFDPLTDYPNEFVDDSFVASSSEPPIDSPNPYVTLTANSDGSYTITPATGYQGIQYLEVTSVVPVTGTFTLDVGSKATDSIDFNSSDLTATATAIQDALVAAGFTDATVTAATPVPTLTPTKFNFNVDFGSGNSESAISFPSSNTLAATFSNSVTAASEKQTLSFDESSPGTSWDSSSNVNPEYTAYVPIFVGTQTTPSTPTIASIEAGGKAITGSTFDNNSSTTSELSFNITGVTAGYAVSVYMDGSTTAIATGTVSTTAGTTTITVTTNGTTTIPSGNHTFTVKEATPEALLFGDFGTTSSGSYAPGTEYAVPQSVLSSAASAGTTLTIGLVVLSAPGTSAQVGSLYTYTVSTNAPSGDTVTVTPVTVPSGMQLSGDTFTWTPTNAQLNTSPEFEATVTDTDGNSTTIGPVNISVILGLVPIAVPVNTKLGGNVTVTLSGNEIEIYDNIGKAVLGQNTFNSTDTVDITLPAGQANDVTIDLPNNASAPLPQAISVQGTTGSSTNNNQVTVQGTVGANVFTVTNGTVTANNLATELTDVQRVVLSGNGNNNYYRLTSSSQPVAVVASGSNNTLDFSHDTAGVNVNLRLDNGQAQSIAPWDTTLAVTGVINYLIGSQYADVLEGGTAGTTEIRGGLGNNTITGGTGNNIILGGGGNDTITGGSEKNLIIGCAGNCSIYANGQQNIVFGGLTNLDSNDAALLNLLNEGTWFMYGYSVRRALASAAGDPGMLSQLLSFDDVGAQDTIFGSYANSDFILGKYCTVQG